MKTLTILNAVHPQSKYQKLNGIAAVNTQGTYNADVLPQHSIRIYGNMTNHVNGPQEFDRVFKLGDRAEYDSYNLIYVGTIVRIGPKTVTIKHYEHSATVTQLSIYGFIDKNWNFDAETIAKHNAIESQCI